MGSPHKIVIRTDHNNLWYWRDPQKISWRIAQEVLELANYDIEIHHLQGKDNGHANALSRREDHETGERDNKNVVVLPDHIFVQMAQTQERIQDEDVLHRWVDPHRLKKIANRWTKDRKEVITGKIDNRRALICSLHDPPVTYSRTFALVWARRDK